MSNIEHMLLVVLCAGIIPFVDGIMKLKSEEIFMVPKEQIAHDLTIAYINNRYGIDVTGDFDINTFDGDTSGSGSVKTEHFPDASAPNMIKVGTGKKGIFGIEKKQKVQSGYLIDALFIKMINDYIAAYNRFLELLG
jgi:hypothetical protein